MGGVCRLEHTVEHHLLHALVLISISRKMGHTFVTVDVIISDTTH